MKKIPATDIVSFTAFCDIFPVDTDPVYANLGHRENHFGQIYHPGAQIWGHRDMVKIVLLAAKRLHEALGWTLVVKDCLRPVEAQALMIETPIVKANPHWIQEPRFLSGPGQGGHPRGMAVDLDVVGVDFGTAFDHFSSSTDVALNPAHREYPHLLPQVLENRAHLENAMIGAAKDFNLPMLALPQEWWDFRFPSSYTNEFLPLSDNDLMEHQKIVGKAESADIKADDAVLEELSRFI